MHEIGQGFIEVDSQCGFDGGGGGGGAHVIECQCCKHSYLHMAMHVAITFLRD